MNTAAYAVEERDAKIVTDGEFIRADLHIPHDAKGIVVFAHGSGSSRFSTRNRHVANVLQQGGLATLLCDLLTSAEEKVDRITREIRFDIDLLGQRVVSVIDWLAQKEEVASLPIGCFGASTGSAAALIAAAERPHSVCAVVSRGGRPDLAMKALPNVRAPVLLIVGGRDTAVIELNRSAMKKLQSETELTIIPGATHLFEEKGALEQVAATAHEWLYSHLPTCTKEEGKQ